MNITRNFVIAMCLSGALAGLAGANQVLGTNHDLALAFSSGYGFDSIALALLGKSHPLGVVLAALLFGILRSGATRMQYIARIPIDIISIIQGMVIIFIAAPEIIRSMYHAHRRPPRAARCSPAAGASSGGTMAEQTIQPVAPTIDRQRVGTGVALLVAGLLMFVLFVLGSQPGQKATFGMNISDTTIPIPDLVLPVQPTLYILILITVFLGGWQLARGGIRSTGWLIGVLAFCFVAAFLIWATKDKSFNLVGMLSNTLGRATPIALAALCGVISERAAVVNIAIEGIMLIAALTAVVSATVAHSLVVGLIVAIITGGLVAALHAVLVIRFNVDQIVSGVAINIFGSGITSFISSRYLEAHIDQLNNSGTMKIISIPLLSKIPVLGPIFFENSPFVYMTVIVVVLLHILLFYTPWGLRTRAVGEHPKAADTLGINVFLMRYVDVILGGMIAGIGGAYFTIGSVGRFDQDMTAGKGFIGLAAMIFGKWTPVGSFLSSLLFGFADSLQVKMQILRVPIPSEFLAMAPYIVTMIVLTGIVGRAIPPAADGTPYEKQ